MRFLAVFFGLASICCWPVMARVSPSPSVTDDEFTTTTTQGPPNPYSFQYVAGRYPGHVDRSQSEVGDGLGHVKGSYSYVDPKFKVRTVEYTVDENGFHPSLINYEDVLNYQPRDSEAVRRAKERHRLLYEKIAARQSQGPSAQPPKDTASVERAKLRHQDLFQKIAEEHAAIAAEREAQRLAYEATSVANEIGQPGTYPNGEWPVDGAALVHSN